MMKYLKSFEDLNFDVPKIEDYVICNNNFSDNINEFLNNTIGQIIDINKKENTFTVLYYDVPDDYAFYFEYVAGGYEQVFFESEILYWSKNKEELEHIIDANKYNL